MQTTNYKGINYGLHDSNLNTETGIRYGVISMHAVDFWHEESEPFDGDPTCPECGNNAIDFDSDMHETKKEQGCCDYYCEICEYAFDSDLAWPDIPLSWFVDNDEISAEQQGDDTDIFVMKSKYFTYAQFCSPCAPGAVHLENPLAEPDENNKGYCFGHDWFESGKAPYPVYSVETGKLV